jgi:polar amino acid transport system substrate-binding protein
VRVVRVGAVGGQAPYCTRDLASGEWRGCIPEFGRDLAKALDAKAAFVETNWDNAVLDLQADKVAICFGLNPTPQRALAIDFTHPLFNNLFTLNARLGFRKATWDAMNVPAVRVALEIGTSYDQAISETCPKATFVRPKSNNEATLAVQTGKADCQVLVALLALSALKRNPAEHAGGAEAAVCRHHQRRATARAGQGLAGFCRRLDRLEPRPGADAPDGDRQSDPG